MPPKQAALLILRELQRRTDSHAIDNLYPDEGDLRRELYIKSVAALNAGKEHAERCVFGGNRVGKTYSIGGYETALHLTGLYPDWWEGHVFDKPILVWTAGTKALKTRDTNQKMLLGKLMKGQGFTFAEGALVPGPKIIKLTRKSGVTDAIDQAVIRHKKGWDNVITFKSYEEGRQSFESEAVDFIWLDEESTKPIYNECKMRLVTTGGRLLSTFTPVEGMTELTISMLADSDLL
jgi:phage terminase large subunit-like protein